jgi:hypothetical protein
MLLSLWRRVVPLSYRTYRQADEKFAIHHRRNISTANSLASNLIPSWSVLDLARDAAVADVLRFLHGAITHFIRSALTIEFFSSISPKSPFSFFLLAPLRELPLSLPTSVTRSMQPWGIFLHARRNWMWISLLIAIAIIRSAKSRPKQHRDRTFRDYVRRTY